MKLRFSDMINGEKIGLLHLNGSQLSDYRISCHWVVEQATKATQIYLVIEQLAINSFFLFSPWFIFTFNLFFLVFRCVCFTLPFNLQNVWTIPKPSVAGSPGIGDRQLMASCRLEKRKEGGLKHRGTKANSRVVSDVSRDKRKKKRKTKKWQATLITGCSYDTRNIKEKKKKGTRQE